ncbi:MAG: polyprenol monophosphomannose synthase [Bacteroidota bacterium]|nr:polyprenol monophosphomannose synthase [Bacteroidota bacterium]
MDKKLVIIPTFNEKENIEAIITAVFNLKHHFHILVVDDNSPDGTSTIVKKLQKKYTDQLHLMERKGKQGLGTAYIAGFHQAIEQNYDYIFEMDADFSHPPKDLINLYEACNTDGADIAVGSRYKKGISVVNWPLGRILISVVASKYVKFITGMPVNDTTAGFVCYKRKVLETIGIDSIEMKGYGFQIEMKFRTWKYGYSIKEVPIIFTDRTQGKSKMSGGIFNEAFWGVIKMRLNTRKLFK